MLSSAMGLCLGFLLLWAGACWLRGRDHAAAVTWAYVLAGLTVNIADMYIFALRARPGPMRTSMLWADAAALTLPVVLGIWLTLRRRK